MPFRHSPALTSPRNSYYFRQALRERGTLGQKECLPPQARDLARLTAAADDVQSARRILETTLNNRSDADQYRRRAAILDREIQALTLVVRDRTQDALDLLHTAAADEQAMPVAFGPPFVDKPASELLGDVLLALDRPADAITAYEAALARAPKRTASLLLCCTLPNTACSTASAGTPLRSSAAFEAMAARSIAETSRSLPA